MHLQPSPSRLAACQSRQGFTLVELLIVVFIIGLLAMLALPGFIGAYQKAQFNAVVQDVRGLLEEARTQALASQYSLLDRGDGVPIPTIPAGGYGVYLDATTATATLFIDDWNADDNRAVDMGYDPTSIANRTIPDGVYTAGSDTLLKTIDITPQVYIAVDSIQGTTLTGDVWQPQLTDQPTATLVFQPPYAETTITGRVADDTATALQTVTLTLDLRGRSPLTRTLMLDRITTTPLIQ